MMRAGCLSLLLVSLTASAGGQSTGSDADWPAWRGNAAHTGFTPRALPESLALQWSREMPSLEPGWPDQPRMQMDAIYEPVVAGRTMVVSSSRNDGVTAYDTRSGAEKWTFFADGPVRSVPALWENRVYVSSDDGYLYCLDLATGAVQWKFRGGPADRRILGNERLISTWPARGGPVIAEGVVYFAAGIWPFMGIFIHALDARTGRGLWTNESDGSTYMLQPHNTDAFAGVAPQGPMTVIGDRLLVSGGRSVPACYDRKTGKMSYFRYADNGRRGGFDVSSAGGLFFAGGMAFDLATGIYAGEFSRALAITEDLICYGGKKKDLLLAKSPTVSIVESVDRKGTKITKPTWKMGPPETVETPLVSCLLRAGSRVYVGSEGKVTIVQLGPKPKTVAQLDIPGMPASLIAADDRLYVVTAQGAILAFGQEAQSPVVHAWKQPKLEDTPTRLPDGYTVIIGAVEVPTLRQMAAQPNVRTIVFDPDPARVEQSRRALVAAGLYGEKVAVHSGDASVPLPPYLATTIVCDSGPVAPSTIRHLYEALRPYGGRLMLRKEHAAKADLGQWVAEWGLAGAVIEENGDRVYLVRSGALPGSANWTHEHADPANTRVSKDKIVRAPLGLLWFGGPSHDGILPRHGHGPQPHVVDGRLIIEGVNMIRATDIYTGRLLWESPLPGVGDFFNNTLHQPGANASGSNICSVPDGIYVAWKKKCVRLDPETGKILAEFPFPGDGKGDWTCVTVAGDYLIGAGEPTVESKLVRQTTGGLDDPQAAIDAALKKLAAIKPDNDGWSGSRRIIVMDRKDGRVLWQASARSGFRNNSICVGGGRLYVVDRHSGLELNRMKKRGEKPETNPRLIAFDLKDGREIWSTEDNVFGTFLSYSEPRDVLVEANRYARDTVNDEPKEMRAWRAADGKLIWKNKYSGPSMIHGDTILSGEQKACDLMTGAPRGRVHPITLKPEEWVWARNYGCNTPSASEHLMTFRSGAAGYFDLARDGGTGNFGGFRSGCTNNLIVAGGLINAPDYTRTCLCAYQNQASVALVPMPEAEMWTFFGTTEIKGTIKRLGVNLGAPGDRKADDGTLWLEHPPVGGKSPAAPLVLNDRIEYFRVHSSRIGGTGIPWVSASGAKGITSFTLTLDKDAKAEQPYGVRLHFVEPDGLKAGQRLFDVHLQGAEVLKDFDIAREAGGGDRAVMREFAVQAGKDLKLKLVPRAGAPVLCGVELAAGGIEALGKIEAMPDVNVVHSDLTVPESSTLLRPSNEEPRAQADETTLRSFLWIGSGALLFMWVFYRFGLLGRRSA
jgi:outer membrane protein assembly factor BamB